MRTQRAVATPLSAPSISHPGVEKQDFSDIIPDQFKGMSVNITEGPTVSTNTKGIPKNLKES